MSDSLLEIGNTNCPRAERRDVWLCPRKTTNHPPSDRALCVLPSPASREWLQNGDNELLLTSDKLLLRGESRSSPVVVEFSIVDRRVIVRSTRRLLVVLAGNSNMNFFACIIDIVTLIAIHIFSRAKPQLRVTRNAYSRA